MRFFPNLPLRHRLTLLSLTTSAVAVVLAGGGFIAYEQLAFKRGLVEDVEAAAQMIGYNGASALAFNDAESAEETLKGLSARPHIVAACIYDKDGQVFATYPAILEAKSFGPRRSAPVIFSADRLELFRPIQLAGEEIGTIYLRSDLGEMKERLRRYAAIIGVVMIVAILVAALLATRLQRTISGPVTELAGIASQLAAGRNYTVRAVKQSNDELGQLIDGFNDMLGQIQGRDEALRTANESLEKRVEERTAELQTENAERRRAEDALQISEQFLQSLVENLPVFIFRKDREGRFTFANKRFCDRFGRTSEEIIGKTGFDLLRPEEAERQANTDARIIATGKTYEAVESSARQNGGSDQFIQLIKVPVFDHDGRCVGVQGMFLDVTERMLAEARLAEASGLLEAMLENSPDLIYFKDRSCRFVRFSKAWVRRFNLADDAMLRGKTDFDFHTLDQAQPAYDGEQEIIRTGTPIIGKLEKETYADGHVTWVLTTKMPWRDGTGAIVGTFGISKDVTALKEAENKLAYERDLLRALLDSSPDTIYFKDMQSRFVLVSRSKTLKTLARVPDLRERRAAKGLAPDVPETELLNGLTDFDTFNDGDARLAFEDEQEIVRSGAAVTGKLEKQVYLDGALRWSLTSKMPWRDAEGKIIGTFGISKDVTELKDTEEKLAVLHRQLLESSRLAGMAEVATGVLHNVGNVLNSVNVSATLVMDQVRRTKAVNVAKLSALFEQNKKNLGDFLTRDPRGQMIPGYLGTLAESLTAEHQAILVELEQLHKNIEHIKEIVAMQQSYTRTSGVSETVSVPDLIEDALRINAGSLARHDVDTIRDYQARPVVTTDKHKVMQILINLIRNAKYACDESGRTGKRIIVRATADDQRVRIAVIDNGVGIPAENLTRVFNHGFTTRAHGHGFGLHSGALAAKELGGSLTVQSEGPGHGATFILELPYSSEAPRS